MDGGSGSGSRWPLSRRESTKRTFNTMAESHRSSSPDSLLVPQDDHYNNNSHSSHRRRLTPAFALPPTHTHFPGDGFDFRRPIMTGGTRGITPASHAALMDLTTDEDNVPFHPQDLDPTPIPARAPAPSSRAARGPRFGRDIIDLESESEDERPPQDTWSSSRAFPSSNIENLFAPRYNQRGPPTQHHHNHHHHHHHHHHHPYQQHRHQHPHPQFSVLRRPPRPTPPSNVDDDLEVLDTRPAPRRTRAPRSVTPYPNGTEPIDLTGDDDVLVVRAQPHQGVNLDRPGTVSGTRTRSIANIPAALAGIFGGNGRLADRVNQFWGQPEPAGTNNRSVNNNSNDHNRVYRAVGDAAAAHIRFGAVQIGPDVEIMMDYNAPAFHMGFEGANVPPQPKYEPPPHAEPGFTRSPAENEIVVCPHCGDELAMGEDELKQQVWVIKKCGHAYCGVCTQNRTKASRTKGKGKGKAPDRLPSPFTKCVVPGCGVSASKASMVHVYLAS